jgi:4-amino-4-deoxy-L-arabinose transferase-like glycosyltransferase
MTRHFAQGALLALVSGVVLVGTAGDYGLTWDEPVYISIGDKVSGWFRELPSPRGFARSFEERYLKEAWNFATQENRNLPVPVLISCVGRSLGRTWADPMTSYRIGHCLLMACTVGFLFGCFVKDHGRDVALVASGTLLLTPPFFAHAHIAATDSPVSCFWILGLLGWLSCRTRPRHAWFVAVVCGLGLASKASFVVFPALLLVWLAFYRERALAGPFLVVLLASPLVMLAFCPMWWADPLGRVQAFIGRALQAGSLWRIDAYYLGTAYTERLPWHNAFVLPMVTTPPWTLVLALAGAWYGLRRRDPSVGLWILGAACLPLLRLLPNAPAHDGTRLMLPSLFCLAPLAGLGFKDLREHMGFGRRGGVVAAFILALGVAEVAATHPFEMSYYSELVGGLPGAERLGFEVSYWFDAFTPRAVEEVQLRLPPGVKVWTAPRYTGYELLRRWGRWRPDLQEADETDAEFLLLYSRKGLIYSRPTLQAIYERESPVWSLRFRGVQLMGLYRLEPRRGAP